MVKDCAYRLMMEEQQTTGLQIYEVDLQTWHWRRLPVSPHPFFCDSSFHETVATAVVQVCVCVA